MVGAGKGRGGVCARRTGEYHTSVGPIASPHLAGGLRARALRVHAEALPAALGAIVKVVEDGLVWVKLDPMAVDPTRPPRNLHANSTGRRGGQVDRNKLHRALPPCEGPRRDGRRAGGRRTAVVELGDDGAIGRTQAAFEQHERIRRRWRFRWTRWRGRKRHGWRRRLQGGWKRGWTQGGWKCGRRKSGWRGQLRRRRKQR